jgi:hypothetical protein
MVDNASSRKEAFNTAVRTSTSSGTFFFSKLSLHNELEYNYRTLKIV